jgi:hypothetical protein
MPHIIIETSKNISAQESLKIGQEIQQNYGVNNLMQI